MKEKNKNLYALCIKCEEPVLDRGQTVMGDGNAIDGFEVSACATPKCERYGLLTTVTR